ncbi:nitrate/TMAO reductase, membrane-bound tetraheme cytochrome c subunit [Longilinea arvoryzae]|uniref:Nitrate/TMAO reductase, membrane-bound tetraheme cytochrome c subunit n=1 Tax=Longilinea arvoryzae TaxID=360412 RepID=A0A0S7BFY0_9CHLR|nr:NapC/NirT family cytochrome c [Longilinea arvoryzae]GAP13908.1 nitrate/TMAO reductase, membrane-bound tetraheme cytochrome c subunit [Longilinea arvoryzae]
MRRFFRWLGGLFVSPADSSPVRRILPIVLTLFIILVCGVAATNVWEVTNQTTFCGLTCHTMPPEYTTHQNSVHARVTCDECHLGRAPIQTAIARKIEYSWQTGTAMLFNTYRYPIIARNMRPARDVCETCHLPEQFSSDSLVELKEFAADDNNTLSYTYLILKTGGGTRREGLGNGIHWHIENPVDYIALDEERQQIPYVRVQNADGSFTEYVDTESGFDASNVDESQLQRMDCITCHNRTAHTLLSPEEGVDKLMSQKVVSRMIPEIKKRAVEILSADYPDQASALDAIAGLEAVYKDQYAEFYEDNGQLITQAIEALQTYYKDNFFHDQKVDWQTHPDNSQHVTSPGCFRCHDGKHLSSQNQAVRLECNLCHSIPVVSQGTAITTNIEIARGPEPQSHRNSNWIALHRESFNDSCQECHTIQDPGGVSNTSFCSNSACHASVWQYAGFDAPNLRVILSEELKRFITPTPEPTATPAGATPLPLTYDNQIQDLFKKCTACHGEGGQAGLNLTSYAGLMKGSVDGAVIIPGDPENSRLVQIQSAAQPHFGQFTPDELATLIEWIQAGAPEK